jgi:ABC-type dipeptide/oligopeptide/nickel transport system ATPase component
MKECFIDNSLKNILDVAVQDLYDSDDSVIVIVGHEGAGKSILAQQISGYLSNKLKTKFSVDNIHFNSQDYLDLSLNKNKYWINLLDESRDSLNKMRGISKNNVEFNNFLSECRDQNQVHIVLLPAFTDLDRYCAIWRSKIVINVLKYRDPITKRIVRGNYQIIRTDDKNLLNQAWEGKYKAFPENMVWGTGRFKFESPINLEDYKNKKAEHRKEKYLSKQENEKMVSIEKHNKTLEELNTLKHKFGLLVERYVSNTNESKMQISKFVGIPRSTINHWADNNKLQTNL